MKHAGGSGAWHIDQASKDECRTSVMDPGRYFQRRVQGRSLSALFLANARQHRLIGLTEQIIRERGGHPYVYCGVVGPVSLPLNVTRHIEEAIRAVVVDFDLVGLNSMDFLCDGDNLYVLEVNPRPSSSMALYDCELEHGLIRAHVEASLRGSLLIAKDRGWEGVVRGTQIVFAERPYRIDLPSIERLCASPWSHDIPHEGTLMSPGEPVCSVAAEAPRIDWVYALLDRRCEAVRMWLEDSDDR